MQLWNIDAPRSVSLTSSQYSTHFIKIENIETSRSIFFIPSIDIYLWVKSKFQHIAHHVGLWSWPGPLQVLLTALWYLLRFGNFCAWSHLKWKTSGWSCQNFFYFSQNKSDIANWTNAVIVLFNYFFSWQKMISLIIIINLTVWQSVFFFYFVRVHLTAFILPRSSYCVHLSAFILPRSYA